MKILLCEDDPNIATITQLTLVQIGGHQVTWVTDGEQAYAKGTSERYDVILLDDMMPKMSGVQVCEAFTKNPAHTNPVIFMSANPQDKRVEQFSSVAIGYIAKPFDPMELNHRITTLLEGQIKKAV